MIPFTYPWIIKTNLENKDINSILELGSGQGYLGDLVNNTSQYKITGVEIFEPYIKDTQNKGRYFKIIRGDITKKLPFKSKSFDAVVCLQTIEHIKKESGLALMKEMERIARKIVIISTPNGDCTQEEYDDNKYQEHLSSWSSYDFRKRGYKVFGTALKLIYGSHSHVGNSINFLKLPLYLFSFIMNPIAYLFPNIAAQIIAVKNKNETS